MSKLEGLKQEAKELGIKFSPNISEGKLQEKIEAHYTALEQAAIEEEKREEMTVDEIVKDKAVKARTMGELAKEAEQKARKTRIVTIIDNDQRENSHTTSVTVNCSNAYFDLGQIILPLNTPVEVMEGHLNVLKEIEIPMHVLDPKTKLSTVRLRKRYSITEESTRID